MIPTCPVHALEQLHQTFLSLLEVCRLYEDCTTFGAFISVLGHQLQPASPGQFSVKTTCTQRKASWDQRHYRKAGLLGHYLNLLYAPVWEVMSDSQTPAADLILDNLASLTLFAYLQNRCFLPIAGRLKAQSYVLYYILVLSLVNFLKWRRDRPFLCQAFISSSQGKQICCTVHHPKLS